MPIKYETEVLPPEEAMRLMKTLVEGVENHPIQSAETFRNAVLGDGILGVNPLLTTDNAKFAEHMRPYMRSIVSSGCMVDFGFIPNATLMEESSRAREVFEAGELIAPYEHWLGISRWEGGCCGYFYTHYGDGHILGVETYGVAVPGLPPAILVNDYCEINVTDTQTLVAPAKMRGDTNSAQAMLERGANILDPLVTFLRFLADASIPLIDVPAPARLNAKRVAQGRHEIPAHTRVRTHDYVSLVQKHQSAKGEALGGHHASPVAHWRRAHQRHLQTGRIVPVRSSKVNWRDTEELHRMFYRVTKP